MILARSPYIVHFDDSGLEDIEYKLYIYTGTKVTDEVLVYAFAIDAIDGEVTFDIAPYIRDYMDWDYGSVRVLWVHGEVAKDTGAGLGSFTNHLTEELSSYGYTDPRNGVNDTTDFDALTEMITDQPHFYKPASDSILIAVRKGTAATVEMRWYTGLNGTGSLISATDVKSGDILETTQQFTVVNSPTTAKSVQYFNGSIQETKNIYSGDDYEFDPVRLTFTNKYGFREYLWFFGRTTESYSTTQQKYKRNILSSGTFNVERHSEKVFNKKAKQIEVINSGFYPEEFNEVFKQLILSEDVYRLSGTDKLPVNIVDSNLTFKTRLSDKMISYQLTIEYSNATINDINA